MKVQNTNMKTKKVLLVEDRYEHYVLYSNLLKKSNTVEYEVKHASTKAEALEMLAGREFDAVLLDLNLPDSSDELETLKSIIADIDTPPPIVVLTSEKENSFGAASIREGAEDYLVKSGITLDSLEKSISYALERHKFRRELAEKNRKLDAAYERLKEKEEDYRLLFETAPGGICILNTDGTIKDINPRMQDICGYSLEEVAGKRFDEFEIFSDDNSEAYVSAFRDFVRDGVSSARELEIIRKDGERIWIETNASIIKKGDEVIGIQIIVSDISERKKAKEQVDRSLRLESTMAAIAARFIGHLDIDSSINSALHDLGEFCGADRTYLFQYSRDLSFMSNTHEWCAPGVEPQISMLQNQSSAEYSWWTGNLKAGEIIHISDVEELPPDAEAVRKLLVAQDIKSLIVFPIFVDDRLRGFIGADNTRTTGYWDEDGLAAVGVCSAIIKGVLEREESRKALISSEERFRRLAENAPDIILRWTKDDGIEYINPAITDIAGYSPDTVLGGTDFLMQKVFAEDREKFTAILESVTGPANKTNSFEFRLIAADGSVKWLEARYIPIRDGEGNVTAVEFISRDFTERIEAEREKESLQQQLLQSQKMEAVGRLAGGMAHDFNNMLTVISGNAQLSLMKLKPDQNFYYEFKDILESADRARDLSMKLLTFARKEKINVEELTLAEVADDMISILRRSIDKKIRIETDYAAGCSVSGDRNQLQQALLNICNNACDAMDDSGVLSINVDSEYLDEHSCRKTPPVIPGNYCCIEITDNGPGIPAEVLPKIFEPFFTTRSHEKNTGLGLSLTFGIIQNHGGCLEVSSAPGEGASFRVYLPQAGMPGENDDNDCGSNPATQKPLVLLVDDERIVLDVNRRMLESAGYEVIAAPGGKEAVDIYSERGGDIDVVILDIIMPDVDGRDVFYKVKEMNPDVRVVLSSGYSMKGHAEELMNAGAKAFVQKPFLIQELIEALESAVED